MFSLFVAAVLAGQVSPQDERSVAPLLEQLGAADPEVRDKATERLKKMPSGIVPLLRKELQRTADAEVKARIETVIEWIGVPDFQVVKQLHVSEKLAGTCVAWSPDGKRLAVGIAGDGKNRVRIFDTATWEEKAALEMSEVCRNAAYSPDGKLLAVQTATEVTIFGTANCEKDASLQVKLAYGGFHFLDDDRIAFAGVQNINGADWISLVIARHAPGSLAVERVPHGGTVDKVPSGQPASFVVSKDGARVVAWIGGGLATPSLVVRDPRTWEGVIVAEPPQQLHCVEPALPDPSYAIAISPDSRFVAGVPGDAAVANPVYVYETDKWHLLKSWKPEAQPFVSLGFSHDSKYLITGEKETVRAWRRANWGEAASLNIDASVIRVIPSPSSDLVAVTADPVSEDAGYKSFAKLLIYRLREP